MSEARGEAEAVKGEGAKRNLVIVRAGDTSIHESWLVPPHERSWDLIVSAFGDDPARFEHSGALVVHRTGTKWPAYAALYEAHRERIDAYDYIWCPDEDIAIAPAALERLFARCQELGLVLAQPSLHHDSFFSHIITVHNPRSQLRFTNFVEVMAPVFSVEAFRTCLPTFDATQSGWGLDILWPRALGEPARGVAIFDEIQMEHARPVGGLLYDKLGAQGIDPYREMEQALQARGLSYRDPDARLNLAGVTADGTRWSLADEDAPARLRDLMGGWTEPAAEAGLYLEAELDRHLQAAAALQRSGSVRGPASSRWRLSRAARIWKQAGGLRKPRVLARDLLGEHGRRVVSRLLSACYEKLARTPKRISAMVCVRDEAHFLEAAVGSIVAHVDEVVLVDRRSDDATPEIIEALCERYPGVCRAYRYDHELVHHGPAHADEAARDPGSPRLTASFYNWCLKRCRYPFVMRWDGDMVATPDIAEHLDTFRRARELNLSFGGLAVDRDFRRVVRVQSPIQRRIFPKHFARFDNRLGVKEKLTTPLWWSTRSIKQPLYLNLARCTKARQSAGAPQPAESWRAELLDGGPLSQAHLDVLRRYDIVD